MTTTASDDCGDVKIITEGSAKMAVPSSEQKASVFYNPVQVQNRDLSVLMISLAAERRAVRDALHIKRQELKKNKKTKQQQQQKEEGEGDTKKDSNGSSNLAQLLREYESTLDGQALVRQQQQELQGAGGSPAKTGGGDAAGGFGGLTVLDALAASGLRSIRYWKEVAGIRHVCINDLDPAAVQRANDNIQRNNLEGALAVPTTATARQEEVHPFGIRVQHGDAIVHMHQSRRSPALKYNPPDPTFHLLKPQYDVIDLDPYGSAAPFLDSAVQAVTDGGMLCVTCTDMRALGGASPETCYGRYSSIPISRAGYLQEGALRILLYSLAATAAKYGRTIRPILSVGMDFYVRIFCEINNDKAGVSRLSLQTGYVYQSTQCPSFHVVPSAQLGGKNNTVYQPGRTPTLACEETGSGFKIGGPIWLGPLHDGDVVRKALDRLDSPNLKLLATRSRLQGLLGSCLDEIDDPLYYRNQDLAKTLHVSSPTLRQVQAALINAGYRVSGYHKEPQAVKTNAPCRVVWDVFRAWYKQHPPKKAPAEGSAAAKIVAVEPSIEVDFTIPKLLVERKKSGIARFPLNPEPHWGPKPKASGNNNSKKRKAEDV